MCCVCVVCARCVFVCSCVIVYERCYEKETRHTHTKKATTAKYNRIHWKWVSHTQHTEQHTAKVCTMTIWSNHKWIHSFYLAYVWHWHPRYTQHFHHVVDRTVYSEIHKGLLHHFLYIHKIVLWFMAVDTFIALCICCIIYAIRTCVHQMYRVKCIWKPVAVRGYTNNNASSSAASAVIAASAIVERLCEWTRPIAAASDWLAWSTRVATLF